MNSRTNDSLGEDFYDAIIAGAGPAGASAAIRLAMNGCRVLLVETKKFPRHKLCGEFISPECMPHFQALGVASEIGAAQGAHLTATRFYSQRGTMCEVPSEWFGTSGESFALGLSRAQMDACLLNRARAVGVEVREDTRVTNLVINEVVATKAETVTMPVVRGAILRTESGKSSTAFARLTIDATGRTRSLVRHLNSVKAAHKKRAALVAFKAHLNFSTDTPQIGEFFNSCEIYFYRGGYGGLNAVENHALNLCFIVRAEDVRAHDSDAARVLREIVFQNERARKMLHNARLVSPWLSVPIDNFGRCALAPASNLLTIGDAAAFIDPFTGSGMLMALESAAAAADAIIEWLSNETDFVSLAHSYETLYRNQFARRLSISSYLRRAAFAAPPSIEWAIRALKTSVALRRCLVRATR